MKNFTMLSLVFIMGFFSCSDNDDKSYTPNESIIHSWTLIKSTGTIAGITHEFPYGTIVWTFNSNNTVTIENNNATENLQSGMPSGTYSFVINPNQASASCEKKITINTSEEFLCLVIEDTQMDINQGVADGINYHFERIMPFDNN